MKYTKAEKEGVVKLIRKQLEEYENGDKSFLDALMDIEEILKEYIPYN